MSQPVASSEGAGTAADGVQRIQAVDRAIVLLKAVAASTTPPTAGELARRCGINRATAWRLLRTLEHHRLVDRDVVTQRYTVGYGATVVASAVTDDALVRRVRPLLTELSLRTGEAVTLAVARRFNLVYVDQVEPPTSSDVTTATCELMFLHVSEAHVTPMPSRQAQAVAALAAGHASLPWPARVGRVIASPGPPRRHPGAFRAASAASSS